MEKNSSKETVTAPSSSIAEFQTYARAQPWVRKHIICAIGLALERNDIISRKSIFKSITEKGVKSNIKRIFTNFSRHFLVVFQL